MSFVWYMWGHFANGAEKEKKKKNKTGQREGRKSSRERGERAPERGARCGLPEGPGGVISWGRAAEDAREEPSPSHPARDICRGPGSYTLIRPRQ